MKKIALLFVTVCFIACSASKTVRTSNKVIKGSWILESITYSKAGKYNSEFLNDASKDCFEGSSWQFIPNNYSGVYSIDNPNCSTGIRHFIFTIQEVDATTGLYDFLLKPTDEKGKSLTNAGYRIRLSALSDSVMQWQQTADDNGSPLTISWNFSKNVTTK